MRISLLYIAIFLFFIKIHLSGQNDSMSPRLLFSTNLVQAPFGEISIYADHLQKRKSWGGSFGFIYPINGFQWIPFTRNIGDYPASIWSGIALRLNRKWYSNKKNGNYFSFQEVTKVGRYINKSILEYNPSNNLYSFVQRSEIMWLLGLDTYWGKIFTSKKSRIYFDLFYGLGVRLRLRNYTTISSHTTAFEHPVSISQDPDYPVGTFILTQIYPTVFFGLKIGLNYQKK